MPLARFSIRQLEAFITVAELLGFAAAGERLGLSASAISQLIAELEATIGLRLFDRSTRRVNLSSAGREFLGAAQSALRHLQLAESAAADLRNRSAGIVRVGAPLTLAGMALPAAVREFQRQRPKITVRIRDVPVDALHERLAMGDVDLAVGPDRQVDQHILRQPLFASPWVLWCSPSHPLASRRTLSWEDLRSVPLVAAGRDHERNVERMRTGAAEDLRIAPVDIVDNITTALGIAAQGLAATLAPAYVGVIARPLGLTMKRVLRPETTRYVCLYRPATRAASPAAEAFGEWLGEWLPRWSQSQGGSTRKTSARR